MYNESIKRRFITFKESHCNYPSTFFPGIFRISQKAEEALGKDLMDFDLDEIIEMYKIFDIASINRLRNIHCIYNQYASWCLREHLITGCQNHFDEVTEIILESCINKAKRDNSFITRKELTEMENELSNANDIALLECLFAGIKGQDLIEIRELKISDFDREKLVVNLCTGRTLKVTDSFIDLMEESSQQEIYQVLGSPNGRTMSYEPNPEGYVFRTLPGGAKGKTKGRSYNSFNLKLRRIFTYYSDLKVTPVKMGFSGQVHFVGLKCNELGITPDQFFSNNELVKELEYRYQIIVSRNFNIREIKKCLE